MSYRAYEPTAKNIERLYDCINSDRAWVRGIQRRLEDLEREVRSGRERVPEHPTHERLAVLVEVMSMAHTLDDYDDFKRFMRDAIARERLVTSRKETR